MNSRVAVAASALALLLLYPVMVIGIPWNYDLPATVMDRGIRGASSDSFVNFLTRLHQGQRLEVALLGGSFSMKSPHLWFDQVLEGLRQAFPLANITGHNAAQGGTNPAFALLCLDPLVPLATVDLIILEFNNNNGPPHANISDARVQSFERLLRRLVTTHGKPAVVIHNFHAPDQVYKEHGYYAMAEDSMTVLAEYYNMLSISMRSALYFLQHQGHAGFSDADIRHDGFHFNKLGHKYAADFFMRAVQAAVSYMKPLPPTTTTAIGTATAAKAPADIAWLPTPMLPNNHPRQTKLCAIKSKLVSLVVQNIGWDFNAEDRQHSKFGFIASMPEAKLVISINTTIENASENQRLALLYIAYLRSYTHMGSAKVSCVSGCKCDPQNLQGHWPSKLSLTVMEQVTATQADQCLIQFDVMNSTQSGGYKFKILGVIVSELTSEPDNAQWFRP